MKVLQLPVIFKKASRKNDGSVTLSFETEGEVNNEQYAFIDGFWKENGWLLFKKNEFKESEIPKSNTDGEGESPSKQLRRSLFAKWTALERLGKTTDSFDVYYEKIISGFKKAVDDSHPDRD